MRLARSRYRHGMLVGVCRTVFAVRSQTDKEFFAGFLIVESVARTGNARSDFKSHESFEALVGEEVCFAVKHAHRLSADI